jgi:hypothetical protein
MKSSYHYIILVVYTYFKIYFVRKSDKTVLNIEIQLIKNKTGIDNFVQ